MLKVQKLAGKVIEVDLKGKTSTVEKVAKEAKVEMGATDLLMVNYKDATLKTKVKDGDVLVVIPKVEGL